MRGVGNNSVVACGLPSSPSLLTMGTICCCGGKRSLGRTCSSTFGGAVSLRNFPSMGRHAMRLFTVSGDVGRSTPMRMRVGPLLPPMRVVHGSLGIGPAFNKICVL